MVHVPSNDIIYSPNSQLRSATNHPTHSNMTINQSPTAATATPASSDQSPTTTRTTTGGTVAAGTATAADLTSLYNQNINQYQIKWYYLK